jgi:hypothetical protein
MIIMYLYIGMKLCASIFVGTYVPLLYKITWVTTFINKRC